MVEASYTRDSIHEGVVCIIKDITLDWDLDIEGGIGNETRLVADLDFESIDIVEFVVAIEEHFKRKGLPFEELLMKDGVYVQEITVQESVTFLFKNLNS